MSLSNTSIAVLRQQMDDSNHELVNMLTNQMATVFNPVIQESADRNRQVANQLTRLCNFLGAPARQMAQVARQTVPVQMEIGAAEDETVHEVQILRPNKIKALNQESQDVTRWIMARNGMGATLQRPLYASPLAEFILQAEAPRGTKVPKYTKFGGESGESTIEHVAKYLIESGGLAHNECLRMAARGLDYSIRKKIDPTFVKSMSQLADRVRHLERLRLEKVRHNKAKKEKVAFVDYDTTYPIYEADYASSTELEVDVAELKPGSAYECRSLLLAQGKNPVENNPKFPSKTYTFDVTKSIQEGRLKFAGRRMKIDADPLHQEEALFVESVEFNMVEITEYDEADILEQTGESPDIDIAEVYPRADEDLVDFLYRCKNKGSQVCLCPRCGDATDKIAAENFQKLQLGKSKRNGPNRERQNERGSKEAVENAQARPRSFVPLASVPRGTWVKP
ncbi:uncharacterized protein LOC127101751 [Lathyrus oleraceus]|uniref:uncharacterized protein LOC127101751 n=1 Tax=Pisum sativum TaxID=3888 RepID=UPI0021D1F96A|nr:uncharacterized protein LOC127101751 [Pisum sativum]